MSRGHRLRRANPRGASSGGGRVNWPSWDPVTNNIDRLLAPIGDANGVPWDAVAGGWFGLVIWWTGADASTHYIAAHTSLGSTRGWSVRITTAGNVTLRVYNAVGAAIEISLATPLVANRFNGILIELDVVGAVCAITVNNGTRTTAACVGYTIPSNAADRLAVGGRGDNVGTTLGPVGGIHVALGRSGHVLTSTMRLVFWSAARQLGMGDWGEPPSGETVGNPNADHKWVAHVLTDRRPPAVLLTKAGPTNDNFHPAVLAW